jgi:Ca2+-binding EF-hand superfamily protein
MQKEEVVTNRKLLISAHNLCDLVEPKDILDGCRKHLGVFFTREDNIAMIKYIDEDNSGDVDKTEFEAKISHTDY